MQRLSLAVTAICLSVLLNESPVVASIHVESDPSDGLVTVNDAVAGPSLLDIPRPIIRPGTGGNDSRGSAAVFFFELPTLGSPDDLTAASLRITYHGIDGQTPNFNLDLFGLGARSDLAIVPSDYYDGPYEDSDDFLIANDVITPSSAVGAINVTGSELLNFIKSLYGPDGTPIGSHAVFRLNPDIDLPVFSAPLRGYSVSSGDDVPANVPTLTLETVPEPHSVLIWGILGVALVASRRNARRLIAKP